MSTARNACIHRLEKICKELDDGPEYFWAEQMLENIDTLPNDCLLMVYKRSGEILKSIEQGGLL